ncbi:hypothetical protein VNO78_08045 [Psophocarpus tetragonolobus]|uniref:Uncharacterized protein n=1 Tax=Psophocarpus tetragonolobus TaxID=3891 RepID=A0AAN9SUF8_PSOTE
MNFLKCEGWVSWREREGHRSGAEVDAYKVRAWRSPIWESADVAVEEVARGGRVSFGLWAAYRKMRAEISAWLLMRKGDNFGVATVEEGTEIRDLCFALACAFVIWEKLDNH